MKSIQIARVLFKFDICKKQRGTVHSISEISRILHISCVLSVVLAQCKPPLTGHLSFGKVHPNSRGNKEAHLISSSAALRRDTSGALT